MKSKIGIQFLIIILMFLTACGGGDSGSSGSTGTINASLTDTSTSEYQAIYVTVKEVAVHKDGGGWQVISSPNKTYNLLELVNGVRENLALATLPTGHYTQLRMILSDTPDDSLNILSKKHDPYGNYFIDNNDQMIELKVPSGFQSGIKIVKGFDINANQTTEIILDFDAVRSIVMAGSSGQWLLKPTIKVLETNEYSIISGNAGAAGVLVSAQTYDSSALLEDKVQVEAGTVSDVNGDYKLFLEPGSYTLVGYEDGFVPFYKNTKVVTAAGNTYTENFSLGSSVSTGTLSSDVVTINGASTEQYATFNIRQAATVNGNPEQIEVKSLNVANGGSIPGIVLPVGDYTVVISSYGKTTIEQSFSISATTETNIGPITL